MTKRGLWMKTQEKVILTLFVIFFFQLLTSVFVSAKEKEFPEKPIQFLVGFAPGSATDLCARAVSKIAPKYLKSSVVVVNMPGAAQTVAHNELVKSPPDGHTIILTTTSYRSLIAHMQKIPFDPKILKILLGFAEFRELLFVGGDSPYAKLENLIDYGRKNPGTIKFGHSGRGTAPHIMGVLLFRSAKVVAVDVPYRGGSAELVPAVLGGHIMGGVTDVAVIKQHIIAGKLKPVAAFLDERLKEYPELPTAKEKGYADVGIFSPIVGISLHRDTPVDRVKKLHDALRKTVEDPEFIKMVKGIDLSCGYTPPRKFEETILRAENVAIPLLKELKLFVE